MNSNGKSRWRPIKSVPSGKFVRLLTNRPPHLYAGVGKRVGDGWYWENIEAHTLPIIYEEMAPTHWMPLTEHASWPQWSSHSVVATVAA